MKNMSETYPEIRVEAEAMKALNMLEDAVVIFDKEWRYIYLNKVGWKTLGRRKEEVLGQNVWELLPHLNDTEFQKSAYKAMHDQKKRVVEEYYPHRQEWYRTIFYPTKDSLFMQMYDITALKTAEHTAHELLGTFEQAMEVYWNDPNRKHRKK